MQIDADHRITAAIRLQQTAVSERFSCQSHTDTPTVKHTLLRTTHTVQRPPLFHCDEQKQLQ